MVCYDIKDKAEFSLDYFLSSSWSSAWIQTKRNPVLKIQTPSLAKVQCRSFPPIFCRQTLVGLLDSENGWSVLGPHHTAAGPAPGQVTLTGVRFTERTWVQSLSGWLEAAASPPTTGTSPPLVLSGQGVESIQELASVSAETPNLPLRLFQWRHCPLKTPKTIP